MVRPIYLSKHLEHDLILIQILKSSIGETELKEISNPGASGSVFYKTSNDKYILKTVQYQEAEFLKTLLAGFAFVGLFFFYIYILDLQLIKLFCLFKRIYYKI